MPKLSALFIFKKPSRKLWQTSGRVVLALIWLSTSVLGLVDFGRPPQPVEAAGPEASVSLGLPGTVFIGNNFSFNVTFANTSGVPTDVGYGPFVDLVFPFNGVDGAAGASTPDGINFISASYLGQAVTAVVLTFPDDDGAGAGTTGTVTHPYAVDTSNTHLSVQGTAGDKLVVLQLPFGSFVPGQTPVALTVNASLSNLADLGAPLTLRYRGGYMFGATPLNDWCCDPVIVSDPNPNSGAWPGGATTPNLFTLTKDNPMAEYETATGPNFPHVYNVGIDIPTGQMVTGLRITDTMPNNAAYLTGTIAATPPGYVVVDQPLTPGAQNPPNNDLIVNWPITLTGAAGNEATTNFSFYIPFTNAVGATIVNPTTGACATSTNTAQSSVNWVPIDVRDGPTPISATATAPAINACGLVGQKGMTIVTDTGAPGTTPGDVVRVTINFQVSDYLAFNNLVITDTLGDGLHFRAATVPTLLLNGNPFTLTTAAMNAANYSIIDHWTGAPTPVPPITGTTDIVFRVSNEVVTRGQATGRLLGGCIPTTGTAAPNCAAYNDGPTTGQIIFEAVVQDQFTDNFPSGDASVDHGDILNNNLLVAGAVLSTTTGFPPTGFTATNTSSASLAVAFGTLAKSIYAIGGNTAYTATQVSPGITVTYRITYSMPSSDFENTRITDYLPLPIFDAAEVTTYTTPLTGPGVPPAGRFKFGPTDSVYTTFGLIPTLTVNSIANTLTFDYGTQDDPLNRNTLIDLLFTVTASDEPFADQLFLTNQVNVSEGTTNAGTQSNDAIVQITLTEPLLRFGKAAVASDNPGAIFSPTVVGPVTFNAPGTVAARWAGIINSTNLAATPINSDVRAVDAGDRITFALIIENAGTSPNGAFDIGITDTLPSGFVIPAAGLNLRVAFGDSAMSPISYIGLGGGPDGLPNTPDDLFGAGLQLVDNPTGGICQAHSLTNGLNIIVITYDLEISNTVAPNQPIINTGFLGSYGGSEGGPNHLTTPLTDTASVTIAGMGLAKTLLGTEIVNATNSLTQVVVGELITYSLAITVPEGLAPNTLITDTLDAGLAFVDVLSVTPSISVTMSTPVGTGTAPANTTVLNSGGLVVFSPGSLTNSNTNNAITETLTIVYRAVALDVIGNQNGTQLNNLATLGWSGNTLTYTVSALNVTVIEPALLLNKSASPTTGDAGNPITFTLRVTNTGPSLTNAFDAVLTDVVPSSMTYVPGSLINVAGTAATLDDSSTPNLSATWPTLALGASSTIQFQATFNYSVTPAQVITNTGLVRWTSLSGNLGTRSIYTTTSTERTGADGPGGPLNDYATSSSASVTVTTVGLVKSITATSEISTTGTGVAIGEIVRYHLVITMPEGTAPSFVVRDNLPTGLQFLDDGTAKVAFVANGVGITSTAINLTTHPLCTGLNVTGSSGNIAPTCVLTDSAVSRNATIDDDAYASGDDPFFKLGTLVNNDNDADAELIVIEFNALTLNIGTNTAGTNRANTFTTFVFTTTQIGTNSNTIAVTIREPSLTLTKQATPTTGDAGDIITYTVRYTNANGVNNTTAFDVALTDSVPSQLTLLPPITVTTSSPAVVTTTTSGNTLTATVSVLPAGGNVVVTYATQLNANVPPALLITNTARITSTTLPGPNGTISNPTGSTTPGVTGVITGERTYTGTASSVITTFSPTIAKSLVSTGHAHTTGNNVAIGEIVTYTIAVTLPEGVITNTTGVTLLDTLDPGLALVECVGVTGSPALLTTLPGGFAEACNDPANPTVGGGGQTLTFNFGTITNTDSNNTVAETLNLTYTVVVLNSPGNDRGVQRNNSAVFSWNNGTPRSIISSAPNVTIVEPTLVLDKSVTPTGADAGDILTFTLRVTNAAPSNTTAFEVVLTDIVPTGVTFMPGSLMNVSGVAATLDESAAPALTATWASLAVGQASTLQFNATVNGTVAPGDFITNTAQVRWTSLPGDVTTTQTTYTTVGTERTGDTANPGGNENDYQTNDSAGVLITGEGFSKIIEATSAGHTLGNNVTIGEIITYTLGITLPEGVTPALSVVDNLPLGLAYIGGSASVDAAGFNGVLPAPALTAGGGNGDDVTFTFGAITVVNDNDSTNNSFRLHLSARVLDVPGNIGVNPPGQTALPNSATLQAGSVIASETITATVVEPSLAITKTITPNQAAANDTLTITLAVQNNGTSTAFDIIVEDAIPDAKLTAITNIGNPAGFTFSAVSSAGITTVRYTGGDILVGETAVFTLTAQVTQNVTAGEILTNTAVVTQATTLPGPDPDERDEPDVSGSDTVIIIAPDIALVKDDQQLTAMPGQTVVYTLTVSNLGLRDATGVVITDIVSVNTTFNAAASTAGWSCSPDNNPGSVCTYPVGNLAAGGSVAVLFAVTVDNPLPAGVTTLTNNATSGDDDSHGTDPNPLNDGDDDVDTLTAAPDLIVTKSDGGITTTPGSVVAYTLTYTNAGNQDATGVIITETVPANTTFNLAASSGGWGCVDSVPAGSVCTLAIGNLNVGAGGSVVFAVNVNNPLPAGVTQIANSTTMGDDGTNGGDLDPSDNVDSDTTPVTASPDLQITKSDSGLIAVPGAIVTYTLVYTNVGNQDATGVSLTETVPANTTFNLAASSVGWSCVDGAPAGSICTLAIGNLNVGAGGSVLFAVTVDNPVPVGTTQLTNTVTIGDDGGNGSDSNPSDNTDTETTPVNAAPNLQITKDDGGLVTLPGSVVAYTLTYTNAGTVTATGVVVTETVPANTTFNLAASSVGWGCVDGAPAGSVCVLNLGALTPGAGGSALFAVNVNNPLPAGTILSNTVAIGDDDTNGNDLDPSDDGDTDTTPVAVPDLEITKDDNGLVVIVGDSITYTLAFTNTGTVDATGVSVTETVPTNTTFNLAASSAGWSGCANGAAAGSVCSFAAGTLTPGAGGILTFVVTVDNPLSSSVTAITNTVSIGDDGTHGNDPDPADNQDTEDTPLIRPDLRISKTDGGLSFAPGAVITYTLIYTNAGAALATGVVITETVPDYTSFRAAGSSAGWGCADGAISGTLCLLNLGAVLPNTSGTLTFTVLLDPVIPGSVTAITNTVSIGDDGTHGDDGSTSDNTGNDSTPILPPTAVELLYFRVDGINGQVVTLAWATAMEIDNYGFNLYRAPTNDLSQATLIHFEPAANLGTGAPYAYEDLVPGTGTWWYWLSDVDTYGAETFHGPINATSVAAQQNYVIYLPIVMR